MKLIQHIRLSDPGGDWTQSDYPAVILSLDVIAIVLYLGVVTLWGLVILNAAQAVTP